MVTTVPLNSSASRSLGIAVISLDFSSTLRWPSTKLLVLAQAEHQAVGVGPGRDHMHDRFFVRSFFAWLRGSPQRLAVDGHYLARRQLGNRRNPGHKTLFQLLWIERRKDPIEGIMRWNATG